MKYLLKTMSGDCFQLSEEQVKILLNAKQKLVAIPDTKIIINLATVESIVPDDKVDTVNLKEKFLDDGRRIIKKWGSWYLADNPDIMIDEKYFPELQQKTDFKRLGSKEFKKIGNG